MHDDESNLSKIYPLGYFFDESFARYFVKLNILPRLGLSSYTISDCKINQLKSRRRKPVIEFKLQLLNSENNNQQQISISLIGKYRNDGLLRVVFDLLQELWVNSSFGYENSQYLTICRPLAYFSDHKLMVTSKAPGTELGKIILQLAQEDGHTNEKAILIETYVLEAARWLAKLHNIDGVRYAPPFSFEKEEIKLREWSGHLGLLYPNFAERISNLFSNILDKERDLDGKGSVLIHGDFNPNNIFVENMTSKMTVIDFEQSCIFNPAKDLGYLIAKLQSSKMKYNLPLDTERLEQRFLNTYYASTSTESIGKVGLFKARSYLQHLHFRYWTCRRNHPPDSIDCKYWMERAEDLLKR
jgi:thiamine kinase-like enzyme